MKKKKDKCQKKLEKIFLLKAIELIFEVAVVGCLQTILSFNQLRNLVKKGGTLQIQAVVQFTDWIVLKEGICTQRLRDRLDLVLVHLLTAMSFLPTDAIHNHS